MILPFFKMISWRKTLATWVLISLNLLFFVHDEWKSDPWQAQWDQSAEDVGFMQTQGAVFAQFIERRPQQYSFFLQVLARRSQQGSSKAALALGGLALRDEGFVQAASRLRFVGDEVAIQNWRSKFTDMTKSMRGSPGVHRGLSSFQPSLWKAISYQFVHGGFLHFATNMLFLLIFGTLLEPLLGSAVFAAIYLLSGAIAAGGFFLLSGLSLAPLIGASGAVNGLVGVFAVFFARQKYPFLYFLLPMKKYWGVVLLPAWTFVVLWVASDLATLLATVKELGGVAHTAHLSGLAAGVVLGLLAWLSSAFFRRKAATESIL